MIILYGHQGARVIDSARERRATPDTPFLRLGPPSNAYALFHSSDYIEKHTPYVNIYSIPRGVYIF